MWPCVRSKRSGRIHLGLTRFSGSSKPNPVQSNILARGSGSRTDLVVLGIGELNRKRRTPPVPNAKSSIFAALADATERLDAVHRVALLQRPSGRPLFGQLLGEKSPSGVAVLAPKTFNVDAERPAVDNAPRAADHDAVGKVRSAQDQGRDRIAGSGKAQVIKGEEGKVGFPPCRDLADVVAADALGRAFGCPAESIEVGDVRGIVAQPPEHHGVTHALHQVGIIV